MKQRLEEAKKLLWELEELMSLLSPESKTDEFDSARRVASAITNKLGSLQMQAQVER